MNKTVESDGNIGPPPPPPLPTEKDLDKFHQQKNSLLSAEELRMQKGVAYGIIRGRCLNPKCLCTQVRLYNKDCENTELIVHYFNWWRTL